MAITSVAQWSTTAANNTDLDGNDISEGCAAGGINDALRSLIAQGKAKFNTIDSAISTVTASGIATVVKDTKANLDADLVHAADTVAAVLKDANPANNDLYIKVGASGSGSWSATGIFSAGAQARVQTIADAATASAATATAAASSVVAAAAATRYGIVLGSGGGAIWDLAHWQTMAFQDSAATTPVTASGNPVGCIRNFLGNTTWDMIQADNSKRPTFQIIDGIPQIVWASGQGLYLRLAQTFTVPFWMGAGLKRNSGYFSFTANKRSVFTHAITGSDNFGVWQAYHDGDIAPIFVNSPFYAAPLGSDQVVDTVLRNNQIDIRINNGPEEVSHSPQTVSIAGGTSFATTMLGVNISGQDAFSANVGAVNSPGTTGTWFGGWVFMIDPDAATRASMVSYFQKEIEPAIRSTDEVIFINGDSTSDDISEATSQPTDEMFSGWAQDTGTNGLRTLRPTDTIYYSNYAKRGQIWTGWRRIQTGSSGKRIFVANASVTGSQPSYHMAGRFSYTYGKFGHIDEHIWNHGHNMAVGTTDTVGLLRLGEWLDSMDKVRRNFPNAAHLAIRTHPTLTGNTMLPVVMALDIAATLYGDMPTADVYTHFDTAGRPPGWYIDQDHVTASGIVEQRAVFQPVFAAWTPAADPSPSQLGRTTANLLTNGLFDDFDSTPPASWTKVGSGTVGKSTDQVDSELGDNYSVKVVSTTVATRIEQTISASGHTGKTLVLAVRVYLESGGGTAGTIQAISDGTGAVNASFWYYATSGQDTGGWRWRYIHVPVPSDATTITVRLYGASGNEAGVAYFGRAVLVEGQRPKSQRH